LFETNLERLFFGSFLLGCVLLHVLSYAHAAKVRTAHRAEVRGLGAFLRKGFIMKLTRGFGIE
jgi:hypothetical protein